MMKVIILLTLLILVSCSFKETNKPTREIASLKSSYTELEFSLDSCLSTKIECSYDDLECQKANALECASDTMSEEQVQSLNLQMENIQNIQSLIKDNDWFFLSPKKIKSVLNLIKELNSSRKEVASHVKDLALRSMHGHGVGVSASAFAVEGRSFGLEGVVFNKELNIFCHPGLFYSSDAGVQLGVSRISTFGCQNKNDYSGEFVSLGAGVSFEGFSIPVAVDLAYSFGLDSIKLIKELKFLQIDSKELLVEFDKFKTTLPEFMLNNGFGPTASKALLLVSQLGAVTTGKIDKIDFSQTLQRDEFELSKLGNKNSLGKLAKKILRSTKFRDFLKNNKYANLRKLFLALYVSLSGCDSVSGLLSFSVSTLPVNVSVSTSIYSNLYSLDLDQVLSLKGITSFSLMNPVFVERYKLEKIIELANLIENFPKIVSNRCYNREYYKRTKAFSLGRSLYDSL